MSNQKKKRPRKSMMHGRKVAHKKSGGSNVSKQNISKFQKPISINMGVIVFLLLLIYIIVISVSYFNHEHITPYEVKLGSLAVNNICDGLILRDEQVITSDYSGYINYYARENAKVPLGEMIYTVDSAGKLNDLVAEETAEGSSLSDEDLAELRSDISTFTNDFSLKDFKDTYTFKYDIEGTVLKLANYKVISNFDDVSSINYSDSVEFGYSPYAGVLVYSTDGYEGVTPEEVTDSMMNRENYEKSQFHSNDLISQGDNAYKIITSENWTILAEIDEDKAASLSNESYIEVRFLKNNYKSWAQVSVLRQNGKAYAKLDFNNSMITFASDRFVEIELLDNAQEGLKVPNSAIVERSFYLIPEMYLTKGGNTGDDGFMKEKYLEDGTKSTEFISTTIYNLVDGECYVDESAFSAGDRIVNPDNSEPYTVSKQATLIGVYNINKGYADFKQVTILNQNEEYAVVKSNTEYGLSVYDHIVLKGDTVNENDLIYEKKKIKAPEENEEKEDENTTEKSPFSINEEESND